MGTEGELERIVVIGMQQAEATPPAYGKQGFTRPGNAGSLPGGGPENGFVLPLNADVQGLAGTLLELLIFLGEMGAYIQVV